MKQARKKHLSLHPPNRRATVGIYRFSQNQGEVVYNYWMNNTNIQLPFEEQKSKEKKLRWLSHTGLEEMRRCPRCFWISYKYKIRLPEGIQSRLANRFDVVLKNYFNTYRSRNVIPPMIEGKVEGVLQNPFKEKYFHRFNDSYGFWGKLDECFIHHDEYIPVDFKTASSDPRGKTILEAYQHQIDEYVYLMNENRVRTAGYGYLIFFYPDFSDTVHKGFPMLMQIVKVKVNLDQVPKRIETAIKLLEGPVPKAEDDCSFCSWFYRVKEFYST